MRDDALLINERDKAEELDAIAVMLRTEAMVAMDEYRETAAG